MLQSYFKNNLKHKNNKKNPQKTNYTLCTGFKLRVKVLDIEINYKAFLSKVATLFKRFSRKHSIPFTCIKLNADNQ